ncbi:UDP-N-acetylglucosamine 2-epimerase [Alphaproteobacteria bacterium]|nr:UDP-N-acetylglucosamine 2-epimerase [Alphaproteobacteria bacterium]
MKLLFINGSRGEWGYIRPVINKCIEFGIDYSICATNMLLLPNYGTLVEEIKEAGFQVDDEIYMSLEGNNHYTMLKSLGIFLMSFSDILSRQRPDWVILAGDRGEQLMGAIACAYTYTPVAHIQAGERSGNIDGTTRHALGKFAHLHFASNQDAAERLLKLGEQPFRVCNVGAPQLDDIKKDFVSNIDYLSKIFKISKNEPFLLVALHPVTEEMHLAEEQIKILVKVLNYFNLKKIWILPNNDAGSETIRKTLLSYRCADIQIYDNITRSEYLGLLQNCKAIIGNSSSGLLEAPTFNTPAVNIGRRQNNRIQGKNVINTDFAVDICIKAIEKAISPEFHKTIQGTNNPYGDGKSSERILKILQNTPINNTLLTKELMY